MRAEISNKQRLDPGHFKGIVDRPFYGNVFYVDPGAGSDTANNGITPENAYATIGKAVTGLTANSDDLVVLNATSSTGRTAETSVVTWSKRRTHMIGTGPRRKINQRNGLGTDSTLTGQTTTAIFTITATNCSFENMSFATFQDNNLLVDVQADYNTFRNVHFQGIGHDTTGDDTSARSLLLTGAGENEFYDCTIGLDTVTRSAANASLEITGSAARNKFIGCDFPLFADNAGAFWVKADTGNCYERFLLFDNCHFFNATLGSSTTLTAGMKLSATGNGEIRMNACSWAGATDLATDYTCLFSSNAPVNDTQDSGRSIQITT